MLPKVYKRLPHNAIVSSRIIPCLKYTRLAIAANNSAPVTVPTLDTPTIALYHVSVRLSPGSSYIIIIPDTNNIS